MNIVRETLAGDGTSKFLIGLDGGAKVECVALFHKHTVCACISSQVGCPVGCRFCATGQMGFKRNLSAKEILGQLSLMEQKIDRKFTNVVFMGMGEPLLNYGNVVDAVTQLNRTDMTWKRITVSTIGIPDKIASLGYDCRCRLAVSLHAPADELRSSLVPNSHSIADIVNACLQYPANKHNPIMIEYVLLAGVNDSLDHANQLSFLLGQFPFVMVNLIAYNSIPNASFKTPSEEKILAFKKVLMDAGFKTIIRTAKGLDAGAACGLLKSYSKSP